MKCIRQTGTDIVRRVSEDEAEKLVRNNWHYISRGAYKRLIKEKTEKRRKDRHKAILENENKPERKQALKKKRKLKIYK